MTGIANYFASVSIKTDEKGLKAVDNYLKAVENKLKRGTATGQGTGKGLVLNVGVNQRFLRKSISDTVEKGVFRAKITPIINKGSVQAIKQQIQSLFASPINIKVNASPGRTPRVGYSWSPNPSGKAGAAPHLAEWMAGRPGRSSLSAANRRYSDSIINQGFFGTDGAPKTLRGFAGESILGGLGRVGSSSMIGRGMSSLGSVIGGARGGALGLIGGAVVNGITTAVGGVWTTLGKMVTAPFKLFGGAISAVTSSFYNLALAAAPLVASFMYINKRVQDASSKDIAINATATRMGTTGAAEKEWLYGMAMAEGMRYKDMIVPYSSFLNAYAPKKGVEASRDMFQSFSQYGRVFGATTESSGRAFYGLSQMVGKDQVMAQELNEQIAEAQGFAGFKQLMAEAYQISLGVSKEAAKKDSDAIAKMGKAMEGGKVKPGDVFPILAELLKEASSLGVEQARKSPTAAEDRFWNKMDKGWEEFTKGGGGKGIAAFWDDLTGSIGQWWLDNGASIGAQFEVLVQRFKVFRIGLTDFVNFMQTGVHNSFTNFVAQEWGTDLTHFRNFVSDMWEAIKEISLNIGKAVGLIGSDGNLDFAEFGTRVKGFISKVGEAMGHVRDMLIYLSAAFSQVGQILQGGVLGVVKTQIPFTTENQLLGDAIRNIGSAANSFGAATGSALGAVTAPVIPTQSDSGAGLQYKLAGMNVGDGSSGMSLRQHKLLHPEQYSANLAPTDSFAGNIGRQVLDVNVNLTVSGDPESIRSLAADEVAKGVAAEVPRALGLGLKSSIVYAPNF